MPQLLASIRREAHPRISSQQRMLWFFGQTYAVIDSDKAAAWGLQEPRELTDPAVVVVPVLRRSGGHPTSTVVDVERSSSGRAFPICRLGHRIPHETPRRVRLAEGRC